MRAPLRWFEEVVCVCEDAGMALAGAGFVAMVLITAVDVVLRYGFSRPLSWAYPVITNYIIVLLYFAAVSATQRWRNHIGIELLTRRLPPRPRQALAAVVAVLMLGLALLIAWTGYDLAATAWENGEVEAGVISWPRWPSYALVPLGFGLLALRLLVEAAQAGIAALGGAMPPAAHAAPHGVPFE